VIWKRRKNAVAERLHAASDAELERVLIDLGAQLDYPPVPALALQVRNRLERELAPPPVRDVLRPYRPFRRSLALALVGLFLVAGAATAALFTLRGVDIRIRPTPPTAPPTPTRPAGSPDIGRLLSLGDRVTLSEARRTLPFAIRLPSLAELASPDEVYIDDEPSGGRVTAVYAARPGLPKASTTGVGLLITQFRARVDEEFVVKEAGPGTRVEQLSVGGAAGFWVEGDPHTVLYIDENGNNFPDSLRLAGNTLLWERDGVTFRLEADISRAQALRIATSFR
jgi:anti-sigma factor RsiW